MRVWRAAVNTWWLEVAGPPTFCLSYLSVAAWLGWDAVRWVLKQPARPGVLMELQLEPVWGGEAGQRSSPRNNVVGLVSAGKEKSFFALQQP